MKKIDEIDEMEEKQSKRGDVVTFQKEDGWKKI